jgi:hypothetical protein
LKSTNGTDWTVENPSGGDSTVTNTSASLFRLVAVKSATEYLAAGTKYRSSGSNTPVIYSSAGSDLTNIPFTRTVNGVYWCNDHYLASGDGYTLAYSDNGSSWTTISNGFHSYLYFAAYGTPGGSNMYVAGGSDGLIAWSTTGK